VQYCCTKLCPPNFLIPPRGFMWRTLRHRGCLWTPLIIIMLMSLALSGPKYDIKNAIQQSFICQLHHVAGNVSTMSVKKRPSLIHWQAVDASSFVHVRPPMRSTAYLSHSFTTVSTSDRVTLRSNLFRRTASETHKRTAVKRLFYEHTIRRQHKWLLPQKIKLF